MSQYRRIFNQTKISADPSLTADQKKQLPPPELLSEIYEEGKLTCVDIRDHAGKFWTIVAPHWRSLRQKLRYFKSLPQETISGLFVGLVAIELPMVQWTRAKGWQCVKCRTVARMKPREPGIWGCAGCATTGIAKGELFRKPIKPPKEAVAAPIEPPETLKPDNPPPKTSMTLRERLEARRAK